MVTSNYPSANDGTDGSIICSDCSRVPSSFTITISCSCQIMSISWRSAIFGSVSSPNNIGLISVSGYISSIFGASVSSSSTPVISSSPIGRFLQTRKSRSLGCPCMSALTCAITVSIIGISSKLLLTNFFMDPRVIKLNPPCFFPMRPMKIAPLVRGIVMFWRVSSLCIWKYCQNVISRCLL